MGDLKSTATWSKRVTLDWSVAGRKNAQISEWRLCRSEAGGSNASVEVISDTGRVNYEVTGLEPNSNYLFQVYSKVFTPQQVAAGHATSVWGNPIQVTVQTKKKPRAIKPIAFDPQAYLDFIVNFKIDEQYRVLFPEEIEQIPVNVLILGRFGGGKSAFVNTLLSALASDLVKQAPSRKSQAERGETHVTGAYRIFSTADHPDLYSRVKCPIKSVFLLFSYLFFGSFKSFSLPAQSL